MLPGFRFLGLVTVTCSFVMPSFAASSPWDGTWKLNKDKSQLAGGTFTLTKNGDMYHFENGGEVACDGREYDQPDQRKMSCEQGPNSLTTTTKQDGKTLWITQRELQPDGKGIKLTRTVMLPDGGKDTVNMTFVRVGEGSGFEGTWKAAAVDTSAQVWTAKVDGDAVHLEFPSFKITWDGKLDGTPAPYKGQGLPPGLVMSMRADGPSRLVADETTNGKPTDHSEYTLSDDGKTVTELDWSPDKPDQKQTFVFDKQ